LERDPLEERERFENEKVYRKEAVLKRKPPLLVLKLE
jgi:hypothetical protein